MMAEMSVIRDGITSNSADLTECLNQRISAVVGPKNQWIYSCLWQKECVFVVYFFAPNLWSRKQI